jgi:hypothetical protein
MSTKYRLAEQVQRILSGGDPSAGSRYDIREIMLVIGQVISKKLQLSHFELTVQAGETIPQGLMLATYGDGDVALTPEKYKTVSKIKLPASPIHLPRNMGVYHIGPYDDPNCGYIPLQTGQFGQVRKLVGMSTLLGQVGYEVRGNEVVFTSDISDTRIMMMLAVMNIDKYDEFQQLPIPEDMEADVIAATVELMKPRVEPNKIIESQTSK